MRICLIHGPFGQIFRDMGHEVLELAPPPGLYDVRAGLDQAGLRPDLLVQTELLGPRLLLAGLETLDCLKIFWSIDTHLNAFWHAHYGALFDAVATTQQSWLPRLRRLGLAQVFHLPSCGFVAPWKPFAKRGQTVAFCGRIGPKRPLRRRFAQFLQERFQATVAQDIPRGQMLELYGDTCLVPNECIAGEINFRLFEAASLGCLVVTPRSDSLDSLFTPGREVETYAEVVELEEKLRHWLAHPADMERLGRRAWARVMTDHLPLHRAGTLLDFAAKADRLSGQDRQPALMLQLALVDLLESDRLVAPAPRIEAGLCRLMDRPEAVVGLLRLHYFTNDSSELLLLLHRILGSDLFPDDAALAITGSLAAIRLEKWDLAKLFWHRYQQRHAPGRLPATPSEMLLAWAGVWTQLGRDARVGFEYDVSRHLPQSGLETMILAFSRDPHNLPLVRAMDSLLASHPGTEETRLALLSELSLHERNNWRLGLRLGLVNLQAFRPDQGLEELRLAKILAQSRHETARFAAALAHADPTGAIRRALTGKG
jgi:hypothetical protein